jgi:ABC-type uncharacterized transport system ATPase subunit
MSSSAITASGLRKAYNDKTVLDGIDLDVRAGTVFSLLGPNGAGKTTTVGAGHVHEASVTSWAMASDDRRAGHQRLGR